MSQYKKRDIESLNLFYTQHVKSLTEEKLHNKSAIAAELAHRDQLINRLRYEIEILRRYGNKDCTAMADVVIGSSRA